MNDFGACILVRLQKQNADEQTPSNVVRLSKYRFKKSGFVCIFQKKHTIMGTVINSYKLGSVEVKIKQAEDEEKLQVVCNDGSYRSQFSISRYEYNHYKRHMNQRIKNAYDEQHKKDDQGKS